MNTEPTLQEAPAAKPKRKSTRKARAAAPAAKPDEFAGMTANDCCDDCTVNRCVITRMNVCGHPYKASHPTLGEDVRRRVRAAKQRLRHQKIDVRE